MVALSLLLLALCTVSEVFAVRDRKRQSQAKMAASISSGHGTAESATLLSPPSSNTGPGGSGANAPLWRRVLGAFCPSAGMKTLLEITPVRHLAGLDGLRSFSMIWIILAHTSLLMPALGTDDQHTIAEVFSSFP